MLGRIVRQRQRRWGEVSDAVPHQALPPLPERAAVKRIVAALEWGEQAEQPHHCPEWLDRGFWDRTSSGMTDAAHRPR
jgi:hypothetical protein